MKVLANGTRVCLTTGSENRAPRTGLIAGHSVVHGDRIVYVVSLDEGFWSEDRDTYVSLLVADESCVGVLP